MKAYAFLDELAEGLPAEAVERFTAFVRAAEGELEEQSSSMVQTVELVGKHMLGAGGKRIRPALVYLCARATGLPFDETRAAQYGVALEMVHMATLLHDDVVDGAATRRGQPTAAVVHGNTSAILAGDVLLAKAMRILANSEDKEIVRVVSESVVEMAEGEVLELEARGVFDLSEELHLKILELKTASFIGCCCQIGAMLAGASPQVQQALAEYGRNVGLAFQVADDLLDYRGDLSRTGKPRATDFREGCATLPLIYLREVMSEEEEIFARRKFGNGVTDDEIAMLAGWMEARGAIERARIHAYMLANQAKRRLCMLPRGPETTLLDRLADFVVRREG